MKNQADDNNVAIERRKRFEKGAAQLGNRLFRIVYGWTFDADLANDIVQEAVCRFLTLMNAQNWSQDFESLDAYLTVIARHRLFDLRRKQRGKWFVSLDNDPDQKLHKEVEQALLLKEVFMGVDAEQLEKLRDEVPLQIIFRGFSQDELDLLQLHKVDELTPKEIAKRRGENADSVRYRLTRIEATIRYRARQYLKISGKKSLF